MEEIRKYPVGIQTFSEVRERNYVYIDKTKYIVEFLKQGSKYVFLSRPRRFGKSLFVSTLHAYYEGKKELFEGLALGDYEKNWIKHPVLHFDMSTAKHIELDDLSLFYRYSAICGISKTELLAQMMPDVESLAKALGKSSDVMLEELKCYYGGYHFSENSDEILCPFSLLKAFEQQKVAVDRLSADAFDDYVKPFAKHYVDIRNIETKKLAKDDFYLSLDQMPTPIPILYQSGVLSIKTYNPQLQCFYLEIPNKVMKSHIKQMIKVA